MVLYNKDGLIVSTIENSDKERVLEYFSENDFNCDSETGALRPSNRQFMEIMNKIISGKDDESNIFVLKKDGVVIGYQSMHIDYDILYIGHIAVKKSERGKGYGELLTKLAILVAENEGRNVALYCNYPNSYLRRLGFETLDDIHYLYNRRGITSDWLPKLFVSVPEYRDRMNKKMEEETKRFADLLNSGILKRILNKDDEIRY